RLQTVAVGAKIQAQGSYVLGDGASVRLASGDAGAVVNAGSGGTEIGRAARVGGVVSGGSVLILDGAVVDGTVVSRSGVTVAATAQTGAVTERAPAVL